MKPPRGRARVVPVSFFNGQIAIFWIGFDLVRHLV
jgi:hypothetical protein